MIVHAAERLVDPPQRTVARLGFWSAAAATVCSLTYSVMQILAVAGVVQGYLSEILIFTPSLLLAPCFVAVLACLYQLALSSDASGDNWAGASRCSMLR